MFVNYYQYVQSDELLKNVNEKYSILNWHRNML